MKPELLLGLVSIQLCEWTQEGCHKKEWVIKYLGEDNELTWVLTQEPNVIDLLNEFVTNEKIFFRNVSRTEKHQYGRNGSRHTYTTMAEVRY